MIFFDYAGWLVGNEYASQLMIGPEYSIDSIPEMA